MASFDPSVILAILVATRAAGERKKFEKDWKDNVDKRVDNWVKNRENQSKYRPQLQWEANVVEYVMFFRALGTNISIHGPRFVPPALNDYRLRLSKKIKPEIAYLRPINIIHPVFYSDIAKCPHWGSEDVSWDSWTTSGSREVHGLRREETALGYKLKHENCTPDEGSTVPKTRVLATTNPAFWAKWEHWKIPRGIPYFFSRCSVTRDLFDLIIEFRPSSTSSGLSEHIKQLHLLEYHEHSLEYLQAYQKIYAAPGSLPFFSSSVEPFSAPNEAGHYNDTAITDDMIRDVYMAFVEDTRSEESDEYIRNLSPGICLSADNTFKAAGKATVVDASKARTKLMKGGNLSMLNELNEIVAWRFCQSASPVEMNEVLLGLKKRCEELGIDLPEMIVVDNCCQVRSEILKALPEIAICLDVYHFMMRYLAVIINGMNNPHRGEVATDVRNAILINSASKGVLAQYWSKEEQETNMLAVYDKHCKKGGVWSAAAHTVHTAQLKHLRKGCLSRPRQDIAADGSRIEGSHKGWNSLQRAAASGLELQNALCHDFVLRRNIRISSSRNGGGSSGLDAFVQSTFGSHHARLVNHSASVLNDILHAEATKAKSSVNVKLLRPMLMNVDSGEVFGLVSSQHSDTFGGLLTIKSEPDENHLLDQVLDNPADPQTVLKDLNIDPILLLQPQQAPGHLSASITPVNTSGTLTPSNKGKEPDTPTTADSSLDAGVASLETPRKKQRVEDENVTKPATHPFFNLDLPRPPIPGASTIGQPSGSSSTAPQCDLTGLTELLPLPKHIDPTGSRPLTRSERLFLAGTGTNPKSLEISGSEFFLFMDMREELHWKSSDMTSRKWVEATALYNGRIGSGSVAKSPRALSDKLGEIERVILNRIATSKFLSQKNDDKFWKRHCFSVPLVKVESNDADVKSSADRVATCKRCNKIMYPGPKGSAENHKKGHCSDGFKQKIVEGEFAPWPQPAGLFTTGSEFHPLPFLAAIREVYEKLVVEADSNITMEREAFLLMLQKPGRIITSDAGAVLFKQFAGFTIPADDTTPEILFTELNGSKYLRVDALRDTDLSIASSST
ncbi:hypothetical protein DFH09DRAFT_1400157 [Mycena vulgaris]|nr:hypothetical protein DFH09DRAFT_1400157 [Mycena vulgaris]